MTLELVNTVVDLYTVKGYATKADAEFPFDMRVEIGLPQPTSVISGSFLIDPDALCEFLNAAKTFIEFHADLYEPMGGYTTPLVVVAQLERKLTEGVDLDCESS